MILYIFLFHLFILFLPPWYLTILSFILFLPPWYLAILSFVILKDSYSLIQANNKHTKFYHSTRPSHRPHPEFPAQSQFQLNRCLQLFSSSFFYLFLPLFYLFLPFSPLFNILHHLFDFAQSLFPCLYFCPNLVQFALHRFNFCCSLP
jgi:hypothetical protein